MSGNTRALAAQVVTGVVAQGQSLGGQLATAEQSVTPRDRALLRELCYGSLRWHPQLRALLRQLLTKPFKPKDADVEQLLVVGAYQLLHTRVPPHAALSATVEACRALGKEWATGLVNGVLRNLQRRSEALLDGLPAPARSAHPAWLWRAIEAAWPAQAEQILAANNDYPPFVLRVNSARTTRDAYLEQLVAAGIAAAPCAIAPSGIRLTAAVDVQQLPGFDDGVVSVQDESAQLAAFLLDAQSGERILDACCAPGGKTGHILERTSNLGALVALDNDAARLTRVASNLARLQLNAELVTGDAAAPEAWWDGQPFDRILLDAPCSGTGVIRRHPDIKLLRTAADIVALAQRQRALLDALWPLLKPGGRLVYATCSILPAENVEVAEAFLLAHADAERLDNPAELPAWGVTQTAGRQLLPTVGGGDGFYYLCLTKRAV